MNCLIWNNKENLQEEKYNIVFMLLFSLITFFIYNRAGELGVP